MLTVDLSNGRVQTYAAKPLTTVDSTQIINTVLESSTLTAENLAGKEWGIKYEKNDSDPNNVVYEVTIADVTMEIPSEYLISLNSTLDRPSVILSSTLRFGRPIRFRWMC